MSFEQSFEYDRAKAETHTHATQAQKDGVMRAARKAYNERMESVKHAQSMSLMGNCARLV